MKQAHHWLLTAQRSPAPLDSVPTAAVVTGTLSPFHNQNHSCPLKYMGLCHLERKGWGTPRGASFGPNLEQGAATFSCHLFPIPMQEGLGVATRAGKSIRWTTGLKPKSQRILVEIKWAPLTGTGVTNELVDFLQEPEWKKARRRKWV